MQPTGEPTVHPALEPLLDHYGLRNRTELRETIRELTDIPTPPTPETLENLVDAAATAWTGAHYCGHLHATTHTPEDDTHNPFTALANLIRDQAPSVTHTYSHGHTTEVGNPHLYVTEVLRDIWTIGYYTGHHDTTTGHTTTNPYT